MNADYDYLEIETYNIDQSNPDNMPITMLKKILEEKPKIYGLVDKALKEKSRKVFGENQDQQQIIETTLEQDELLNEIADLKCPITQDIMEQPVIAQCGHTFDKFAIGDWINRGNTCPNCKKAIDLKTLVPNQFIISLIKNTLRINQFQQFIFMYYMVKIIKINTLYFQNVIIKKNPKILFCQQTGLYSE